MRYQEETFCCSVAELRALTRYASDDQTRLHLTNVCFDATKGRAAATDGHRLLVVQAHLEPDHAAKGSWIVSARALATALKGLGTKKTKVDIKLNCRSVALVSGDVATTLPVVDATFPPIDQVIPAIGSQKPADCVGFNADYLADIGVIADMATALDKDARAGCKVRIGGELDPVRIDADFKEGSATIVVMPMRL